MNHIALRNNYAEGFLTFVANMAQHLIADYHGERVAGEIIEFSKIGDLTRRGIERALSNEVITPGQTTLQDVSLWFRATREKQRSP